MGERNNGGCGAAFSILHVKHVLDCPLEPGGYAWREMGFASQLRFSWRIAKAAETHPGIQVKPGVRASFASVTSQAVTSAPKHALRASHGEGVSQSRVVAG